MSAVTNAAIYAFGGACVGGIFVLSGTIINTIIQGNREREERDRSRLGNLYAQTLEVERAYREHFESISTWLKGGDVGKDSPITDDLMEDLMYWATLYYPALEHPIRQLLESASACHLTAKEAYERAMRGNLNKEEMAQKFDSKVSRFKLMIEKLRSEIRSLVKP